MPRRPAVAISTELNRSRRGCSEIHAHRAVIGQPLPQQAVGEDAATFLRQTCVKAGLPPDAWQDADTRPVQATEDVRFTLTTCT